MATRPDSEFKLYAALATRNLGKSPQVVQLLDDDDALEGCKMPVAIKMMKQRKVVYAWTFCGKPSLYQGIIAWKGVPFCNDHAISQFHKCVEDECTYKGNYHGGPWDYDVNAPASDEGDHRCYLHASEYGL
jgi:hypothetical protein